MKVAFFGEYGCPKGKWGLSKKIEPHFEMNYRGQLIYDLKLPIVDCVKEMECYLCEDCPVNGKVESNLIKMWKNHPASNTEI